MSVQGFWGLACHPGKTYSQIVSAPFRIAMASLTETVKDNKRTSVTVNVDNKEFVLCTLVPNKIEQQALDISFVEGEEVTFAIKGENVVHLTGNYVFNDDEDIMGSEDENSESGDELDDEDFLKKLPPGMTHEQIQEYLAQGSDFDEEIDSDDIVSADEVDEEDEEDNEESEEEESEEEEKPAINNKRPAQAASKDQPAKKQKAAAGAVPTAKEEPKKKEQKKKESKKEEAKKEEAKKEEAKKEEAKKEEAKKEEAKKEEPKKKKAEKKEEKKEEKKNKITKLPNGLIIEDVRIGDGASCKSGHRVGMRYIGKLTTGKVFDKNVSGKPFYFLLGRGEVIRGWDIGVAGMKVGGERKLTIPAALAYGKSGAPPDIPKNATLVFDVKLLSMK